MMTGSPRDPLTADQLARYLFGEPLDPRDQGVVGRLMAQVEVNTTQVRRLLRLSWGILLAFIGCLLALIGNLVVQATSAHPVH